MSFSILADSSKIKNCKRYTIDKVLIEATNIAGFDGSANTGTFESGTITVIYSGNSAGDDYEEYVFIDANFDGIIDAGELSNDNHDTTTAFAAGGTITFEQYDTQNFDAGVETIEIIGTFVIPEFGTIAAMILAVAIISIIAISSKSRLLAPRI